MRGFPVMVQLRPQLNEAAYYERVSQQMDQGYQLAHLTCESGTATVAGFRFSNTLAWGKILYVDDLVTSASERSHGYGAKMLDWLLELARENDCTELHLDSDVQRFGAHKFYLTRGLDITCHHFAIKLK